MAEAGAQIKSIENAFSTAANNIGISSNLLIADLKRVTNETIDDSDLMKKSMRLMVEGFSQKQIVEVGEDARVAARLMGTDVSEAFNLIADAEVNLRLKGLKTAGIVIDEEEAYRKYAATLRVSKGQLNDLGKEMALQIAVHEKMTKVGEQLGMSQESLTEKIQQQKSAWKELWNVISKATAEGWDMMSKIAASSGKAISKIGIDVTAGQYIGQDLWKNFGTGSTGLTGKTATRESQIKSGIEEKLFKMPPDIWESFKGAADVIHIIQGDTEEMIPVIKNYEGWWDKINKDIEETQIEILKLGKGLGPGLWIGPEEQGMKSGEMMLEGTIYDIEFWKKITKEIEDLQLEILKRGKGLGSELWVGPEEQVNKPGYMTLGGNVSKIEDVVKQMGEQGKLMGSIGADIANIWSSNLSSMLKGTESFSEGIKNIFADMGSYVIDTITKMAVNYALFGSLGGTPTSGLGILGWAGKTLGLKFGEGGYMPGSFIHITPMASGGYFDRPTLGLIGEKGEGEFVIPKSKMGGGGGQTINYIHIVANDSKSFVDMVNRNEGAFTKIITKSILRPGGMRDAIRRT